MLFILNHAFRSINVGLINRLYISTTTALVDDDFQLLQVEKLKNDLVLSTDHCD